MDELIDIVNNKQEARAEAAEHRKKREDCKVIYKASALTGFGLLILAAHWIPVLAIPAAWIPFAAAVVVVDRHLRHK